QHSSPIPLISLLAQESRNIQHVDSGLFHGGHSSVSRAPAHYGRSLQISVIYFHRYAVRSSLHHCQRFLLRPVDCATQPRGYHGDSQAIFIVSSITVPTITVASSAVNPFMVFMTS